MVATRLGVVLGLQQGAGPDGVGALTVTAADGGWGARRALRREPDTAGAVGVPDMR